MDLFSVAFNELMQVEGVLSLDPNDRGNWTSGIIGQGKLKGTKYGISAMSYPDLNIRGLTLEEAAGIYHRDYWLPLRLGHIGSKFPTSARMLFNVGVNCGLSNAVKFLQTTINTLNIQEAVGLPVMRLSSWQQNVLRTIGGKALKVDGVMGPLTLGALMLIPYPDAVSVGIFGEAYKHYAKGKLQYRAGWLNRLGHLFLDRR